MSAKIEWAEEADADLNEIIDYYLSITDEETTFRSMTAILEKVEYFAEHTMAGGKVQGMSREFKQGYTKNSTYRIYYRVMGENSIKVLMILHSRRERPSIQKIQTRDK